MTLPTLEQSKLARKLLRQEVPMDRVIVELGGVYDAQNIADGIANMRLRHRAQAKRDTGFCWKGMERVPTHIPADRLADRDYRAGLRHASLGAELMGDPLPGYSAADRAPSITPSIHHDPLDDLMFSRRKVGMRYG